MTKPRGRRGMTAALGPALVLWAMGAGSARAATCSFTSVTGPVFGAYDVFSPASTDSAGNIAYTCSGGATLTIALSTGNAPTFSPRLLLRAGGFTINYNLYLDAGHATIWGDGSGVSQVSGPTTPVDGAVVMVPIFASIPARQDVGVGMYSDTIVVTLNF